MEPTQTIEDLGRKIKTKYGGVYDDLSDEEVGKKAKQKYPGSYDDFKDLPYGQKPQFQASIGGASTIVPNVAKTFGNLPSSAAHILDSTLQSTAGNIGRSLQTTQDIYKNRGLVQGTEDIASGFADTGKKIFEAPGKFLVGSNDKANLTNKLSPIQEQTLKQRDDIIQKLNEAHKTGKDTSHLVLALKYNQDTLDSLNSQIDTKENRASSGVNTLTNVAKYPIERPSDVVLGLYGGESATGKDAITNIAKPITRGADTSFAGIASKAKNATSDAILARQPEAINQLEQKYTELFTGQSPSKQTKFKNAQVTTELKNKAGTQGKPPQRVLAEAGIVPEQSGSRLSTINQAEKFRENVTPLREVNRNALKEVERSTPPIPFADAEAEAIRRIQSSNNTSIAKQTMIEKVKGNFAATRSEYGENATITKFDDIKSDHWAATKFDAAVPQLDRDVNYAIAKAYQKTIEDTARLAGFEDVAQLNRHIGDTLEAAKFLEGLNGKVVTGGQIGKYALRFLGSSLGKTIPGKIIGYLGGEFVADLIISNGVSGPVKRLILNNLSKTDPVAYTHAIEWLEQQGKLGELRLQLPAPKVLGSSDNPIILPAPTTYERQANIINREKSPDQLQLPAGNKNSNLNINQGRPIPFMPKNRNIDYIGKDTVGGYSSQPNFLNNQDITKNTANVSNIDQSQNVSLSQTRNIPQTNPSTPVNSMPKATAQTVSQKVNIPEKLYKNQSSQPNADAIQSIIKPPTPNSASAPTTFSTKKNTSENVISNLIPQPKTAVNAELSTAKKVPFLPKEVEPLATEARKYKSAEEFVRAQEIKYVPITKIKSIGTKDSFDPFSLDFSKKEIQSGKKLEPIEVILENGKYTIQDGEHRFQAYQEMGIKDIPVKIQKNSLTDFYKKSVEKKKIPFLPKKNMKTDFNLPAVGQTAYQGETDLTTKILKDLEGKTTVPKEHILDALNNKDIKPAERTLIGNMLSSEKDTVNVPEFAKKVKAELLPLRISPKEMNFPEIALPEDVRGRVKSYKDRIYESPIKTSAGERHFPGTSDSYFGHTSIEDMADGKTRRVLQVQSDLYQKGNKAEHVGKLEQYNNPSAHFRLIREEIKKAAEDGKTRLQFPTGKTIMDIEGLGEAHDWSASGTKLNPEMLKVGKEISDGDGKVKWIITDVLPDGKFKAISKNSLYSKNDVYKGGVELADGTRYRPQDAQIFDVSDKVDTSSRIYRFYEKDIQKYLDKFGGKQVVDDKGVSWVEVPIKKEYANQPVDAFGKIKLGPLLIGAGLSLGAVGAVQAVKKKVPFLPRKR